MSERKSELDRLVKAASQEIAKGLAVKEVFYHTTIGERRTFEVILRELVENALARREEDHG